MQEASDDTYRSAHWRWTKRNETMSRRRVEFRGSKCRSPNRVHVSVETFALTLEIRLTFTQAVTRAFRRITPSQTHFTYILNLPLLTTSHPHDRLISSIDSAEWFTACPSFTNASNSLYRTRGLFYETHYWTLADQICSRPIDIVSPALMKHRIRLGGRTSQST